MPNAGQPKTNTKPRDPQPGGREPAPGGLRLVQAFVNSNYDLEDEHGAELLGSPEQLATWLTRRGLVDTTATAREADLQRALALREGLRELLIAKHDGREAALNVTISARVELTATKAELQRAGATTAEALDLIAAHAAAAQWDGSWHRLKACRECAWAFYDNSRNGAGNWCSMKVCGGRVKQRAHYSRRRGTKKPGQS